MKDRRRISLRADVAESEEWGLIEALASGQAEALNCLHERYEPLLRAQALQVVRDHGRAEEVAQDCFLKLWCHCRRFNPNKGSLRTWLLTWVRNRSIDYLRGRYAHQRQELQLPPDAPARGLGSDPWHELSIQLARADLQTALAKLPARQSQALQLAYFGGYSQPEIARIQGVPLSTVKGRIRIGLKRLMELMEAEAQI